MPVTKRQLLSTLAPLFAYDNAEAEGDRLQAYFVETDAWIQLSQGHVAVIKGLKGSGKSALYALLCLRSKQLLKERIVVVSADEPRGSSIFASVLQDADDAARTRSSGTARQANENDFGRLWQLYFLTLIGDQLARLSGINLRPNSPARRVVKGLEDYGLLMKKGELVLRQALEHILRILNLGVAFNTPTGAIVVELRLPEKQSNSQPERQQVSELLQLIISAEKALAEAGLTAWLAIDRLDEMFSLLDEEVEAAALRALLHTLRDLQRFDHIKLKLFVRDDLLQRVTQSKGRVTAVDTIRPDIHLEWPAEKLLDLVMRRLLQSADLRTLYSLDDGDQGPLAVQDPYRQAEVFQRIFPLTVDDVPTLDWLCRQLKDGNGRVAPRDFLRLIYHALEKQQTKRVDAPGEQLFSESTLRDAAQDASEDHYQQAFKPEYPRLREFTDALRGHRQGLTFARLHQIWSKDRPVSEAYARDVAKQLTDVALLQHPPHEIYYRVAPLYHAALEIRSGDEV